MKEKNRIAVLAGAGLAFDAGLPMSVQLVSNLKESLLELANSSEASKAVLALKERASRWLELFRFLNGGIRFQEGVLNRDPDAPVNIEQIAIAAEGLQARAKNPLAPYASGWHQRLQELERVEPDLLKTFVDFVYSQLQRWLTLKQADCSHYMARLSDFCDSENGVDIFTLNYDLAIEVALTRAKKSFTNGFTEEGEWDATKLQESAPVRLFKLHGSLDWVEDQVYGLCSLQYPRHKEAETIQGDETRPLLIFGTAHKLTAKEPFLTLAYHLSQRILKAQVLTVIGYSFGDDYVNQIIEQGIKQNTRLRIVVVSPNASSQIKAHGVLDGSPRVLAIDEGARDALNKGTLLGHVNRISEEASAEEPFN